MPAADATPRLRRAERRDQIIAAATRAFARGGFTATSLDDVAREASVSRVIVYRHFASKADLYRAVLDRVCDRLLAAYGPDRAAADVFAAILAAAAEDPDGFRLLFHHNAREPEFERETRELRREMTAVARAGLQERDLDPSWSDWAIRLSPVVAIEGILAWLDAGEPDPEGAAERIGRAVEAVVAAARAETVAGR